MSTVDALWRAYQAAALKHAENPTWANFMAAYEAYVAWLQVFELEAA